MQHLAIVGAGATGTALLVALKHQLGSIRPGNGPARVTIFEKTSDFGPGLPYGNLAAPIHLNNMESADMSVDAERPSDFLEWLDANRSDLDWSYSMDENFVTRRLYGGYLKARFEEACETLRSEAIEVEAVADEVMDITELRGSQSGSYQIVTNDRRLFACDCVILATGHWHSSPPAAISNVNDLFEKRQAGGYIGVWPIEQLLNRAARQDEVIVLGSSLTAVDAVMALAHSGGSFVDAGGRRLEYQSRGCPTIRCVSRRGYIPSLRPVLNKAVHDKIRAAAARHQSDIAWDYWTFERVFWQVLRNEGFTEIQEEFQRLKLDGLGNRTTQVLSSLERELSAAEKSADWHSERTAFRAMYRFVVDAYTTFSRSDRTVFFQEFFPLFNVMTAAVPILPARRLRALLRSGVLEIYAGKSEIRQANEIFEMQVGHQSWHVKCVGNAIGREREVRKNPSKLIQNLLQKGLIVPHDFGGVQIDEESSTAVGAGGVLTENLLVLGELTIGARLGTSAVAANAKYARQTMSVLFDF